MFSDHNKFGFGRVAKAPKKVAKSKKVNDFERSELFDQHWKEIENILLKFSSSMYEQYVQKLFNFIDSHITFDSGCQNSHKLISSAIIALSCKDTQKRITQELDEFLTEKETGVKTIHLDGFQVANESALFQVIFSNLNTDPDIPNSELVNYSFSEIMERWIEDYDSTRPSLAIFFHDFENFNKNVLSILVSILKEYTDTVSIVFVFMIYNPVNSSLEYILPASVTDCLLIEDIIPFYEPKLLPHIFKEFITDPRISFKIHPMLIKEIDAFFSSYEFSFANFLPFIKSLVLDHFYENPLSTIYSLEHMSLSDQRLEDVFRNSLTFGSNVSNRNEFFKVLHCAYRELLKKHHEFTLNLEVISSFREHCIFEGPQKFVTLYADILNSELDIKSYFYPLLKVKESVFLSAIDKVHKEFKDLKNNSVFKKIINFRHDLENLLAKESEENKKQEVFAKKAKLDYEGVVQGTKLRGLNARAELRKSLMTSIQDSQKISAFEKLKGDLVQSLIVDFEQHALLEHQELINGLFYHNTDFIRASYIVSIRQRFNTSFDIKYDSTNVSDNLVMYRMYKEAGKIFNIHDMFKEFCEESELDLNTDKAIVHFSNALADFEYIGLVQPSRKTDFMNKVVWL